CLFTLVLKSTFPKIEISSLDLWNDEMTIGDVKGYMKGVDANIIQNLFPLPFREGSFDLVYAPLYFYNVTRERRDELAGEVHRVVKPGSFAMIIDLEIVRNLRKSFMKVGFKEVNYYANQGVFFSLMQKSAPSFSS
ncbi:MAG: class I SAM-dependent methyltransferase, partial [Metallosphaera sp.]